MLPCVLVPACVGVARVADIAGVAPSFEAFVGVFGFSTFEIAIA